MNIGQNIKKIRKSKGLSQIQLSKISKVAQSSISEYETGGVEPNLRTLIRLAKALGVSVESILYGEIHPKVSGE